MIKVFLIGLALASLLARAENAENESRADLTLSRGNFHGITFKCKPDDDGDEAIETTPGGVPLVVDDPGTPGCRNWEINLVADADLAHSDRAYELPLLDMNYGVGDNLQLKYEVPNAIAVADGQRTAQIGDSIVGVKVRFYDDEDRHLFIGTYPQLQFSTSTSSGSVTILPLLISARVGKTSRGDVMMTTNLGYNVSARADMASFVNASVGLGIPAIGHTALVGEIVTEQAVARIGGQPRDYIFKSKIGMIGPVTKNFALFGSLGRSLATADHSDHVYALTGFRILTGE